MAGFDHPLVRAAAHEATSLHVFFEAWLGGTITNDGAAFLRLEAALAPSFTMVTPDGRRLARPDVVGWLRQAHGAKREPSPFRIAIRDVEVLHLEPPLVAIGYVEEQVQGKTRTARRSTALFCEVPEAPQGVRWLALHETWIGP